MASGDIEEYDRRNVKEQGNQIATFVLEIIVANGTSEKKEELPENFLESDAYLEAPNLSQGSHKVKLEQLTRRQNVIYCTGDQVSDNDEGTSTTIAETVITDSSKGWALGEFIDKYLMATDGAAKGKKRRITANDATTITCTGATFVTWGMEAGDKFTICESFPIHLQRGLDRPTIRLVCDANVNKDEIFFLEMAGM